MKNVKKCTLNILAFGLLLASTIIPVTTASAAFTDYDKIVYLENKPKNAINYGYVLIKNPSDGKIKLLVPTDTGYFYYSGNSLMASSDVSIYEYDFSGSRIVTGIVVTSNSEIIANATTVDPSDIVSSGTIYTESTRPDKSQQSEVSIQSGELAYTAPTVNNFPTFKLQGQMKTDIFTSLSDKLKITDARGTREGWTLKVSATQFVTTINGSPHKLDTGSLLLANPVITSNAIVNPSLVSTPLVDSFTIIDDGTYTVATALAEYDGVTTEIDFGVNSLQLLANPEDVVIDKTTKQSTYTSTITWSLMNAPE